MACPTHLKLCGSLNKVYLTKCQHHEDCSSETNLNDIPVLNYCSKQLFVFRIILLFLQVSRMLEGKNGIKRGESNQDQHHCSHKPVSL